MFNKNKSPKAKSRRDLFLTILTHSLFVLNMGELSLPMENSVMCVIACCWTHTTEEYIGSDSSPRLTTKNTNVLIVYD